MQLTMTRPEELLGRHVFDVLPENPAEDGSRNVAELRASFDRVINRRLPDELRAMRYDMRNRAGAFVERYWRFSNHPVPDQRGGDVLYVLHIAVDETESVLKARQLEQAGSGRGELEKHISEMKESSMEPPPAADLLSIAIETNFDNLTSREKEVLKLAIAGRVNKEIAFVLGISVRTVESFRTSILRKTLKTNFLEISRAVHELARSDQEKR